MSDPDVVAELDAWIATCDEVWGRDCSVPKRARDEIVALRERLGSLRELSGPIIDLIRIIRAEALEEVAQIMDLHSDKIITGTFLAWAIRALKERDDERAGRDRGAE